MFAPVYFDHNATTPLAPGVLDGMLPYLRELYGNASSRHEYGRATRRAIDEARQRVAFAVGAHPTEIVFTGGGSEANNLFIKGVAASQRAGKMVFSAVEHPCVREPARQLQRQGWDVSESPVTAEGRVDPEAFAAATRNHPALVSIMLANNETGVVQPITNLAASCKSGGAWFHTDAVQAFGKVPVNFRELNSAGVHALTLSAHKFGGPKGVGALVIDKRVEITPLIAGSGHERGLRAGTENVAGIVGFGLAAEYAVRDLDMEAARQAKLRNRLEEQIAALGAVVFGQAAERLPNTSFFALPGIDGETLIGRLDRAGFALASGAACSSANPQASRVLLAMGVSLELAKGAVRLSVGRQTTAQQIDDFVTALRQTLAELNGLLACGENSSGRKEYQEVTP